MKLLVIVSRDYGELGHALYFLDRHTLVTRPLLLLPAAMRDPGCADAEVRHYAGVDDITGVIADNALDAVLLFSGYLLQPGRRHSLLYAARLLALLRRRGIPVLTSDPFMSTIRSPWTLDFAPLLRATGMPERARLHGAMLGLRLYLMRLLLRRAWHLYPARMRAVDIPRTLRWSGYFNGNEDVQNAAQPRWVFVLAQIDGDILLATGPAAFIDALCARLDDAVRAGRQAVLVASARVLAALPRRAHSTPGITLHTESSYADYMDLVMGAEYLFFWNYFSFSIIHRVISERPVFFFGAGHMVKILPALAEHGIANLYAGQRPMMLEMAAPLDAPLLAELALEVRARFARIDAGLRTLPSPQALLDAVQASR